MDSDEFIREIARRANFTIKDTRTFYYTMLDIITDCVATETPLDLRGWGHLEYVKVKPRRGSRMKDVIARKNGEDVAITKVDYPEATKINFRLSRNVRDILRNSEDEEKEE